MAVASLSPLDEEADGGIRVPERLEDGRALDVAAVDVVHPQDAVVHSGNKMMGWVGFLLLLYALNFE